jgi:hypothetical protein
VSGVHFTSVPSAKLFTLGTEGLSAEEAAWSADFARWNAEEGAYSNLQRTKPQTLAAALSDSPAGLASWFLEKYQAWCDGGDALDVFGPELLATNATLYWVTGTAASSVRYYYDARIAGPAGPVSAPVGVAVFPRDVLPAPRSFAERVYRVTR